MTPPTVLLATLCLNEMEWLPKLYEQHRDWPGLVRWVFVEAADTEYRRANPDMVDDRGLSVDGTTEFLADLHQRDNRVTHVPHGFSGNPDPAKGKCEARQRYLDVADSLGPPPSYLVTLDADEFYTHEHQRLIPLFMDSFPEAVSFVFHRREVWRPPSLSHTPLMAHEVVGGFWGIPCCHWWRYVPGMHYGDCHNTPTGPDGRPMNDRPVFLNDRPDAPQMVHLGFAAGERTRLAKNRYYAGRGEGRTDHRDWYVRSRAAWRHWTPGMSLPRDARVAPYTGPVPECFSDQR